MKKYLLTVLIILHFLWQGTAQNASFVLDTPQGNREVIRYKTYYYISFNLEKPSDLVLRSNVTVRKVETEPGYRNIPFRKDGNNIEFRLEKPGYILIRLNDSLKIFVFAEVPERIPAGENVVDFVDKYHPDTTGRTNENEKIQRALDEISGSGKILLFPPGIYKSGQIQIRSDSRIYLAGGAEIVADTSSIAAFNATDDLKTRRFIYCGGAKNVEIKGYGSINGNGRILRSKYGDDARMRLLLVARSGNITVEGLILKDPGSWNTHVLLSEDIVFRNVKLLNDTELSNTDGFDPDAVKKFLIEDCFACCGDDNVAVKTTGNSGLIGDVDGVRVKGCVFLTKKSALKIGTETRGETMNNIIFENNDVLECDRGIAIYVQDGAHLDKISYRDNRFERNFPDAQRKAIHIVVNRRNADSNLGTIHNLTIRDCSFNRKFPRESVISYDGEDSGIEGTIENLIIEGKKREASDSEGLVIKNSIIEVK